MTNATLTGPIPVEMGELVGLRRLWLYANTLTGTVPAELANLAEIEILEIQSNDINGDLPADICSNILAQDYEFKALAVDCDSNGLVGVNCNCPDNLCQCYEPNNDLVKGGPGYVIDGGANPDGHPDEGNVADNPDNPGAPP